MKCYKVLLVVELLISLAYCVDLPENFTRCYRDDKKLENCLLRLTETLKPYIKEGFPKFQIPSLDPLFLPTLDVFQKSHDFAFKVHLENLTLSGLQNYKFEKLRFDPDTLTFYGRVRWDRVVLVGAFRVKGKVVIVPVETDGRFTAAMGPIVTNFTIKGNLKNRRGEVYYVPVKTQLKMNIEDIAVRRLAFTDGENMARTTVVDLFNANSKLIIPRITSVIEEFSEKLITRYVGKFTNAVPYNKLLPLR